MSRIDLPNGQWADILDADTVTAGQRKRLFRAFNTAKNGDADALDTADLMLAHAITGWSYTMPLPDPAKRYTDEDPNPLDELPAKASDVLLQAAAALVKDLTPDVEPSPDPASPTSPSGA